MCENTNKHEEASRLTGAQNDIVHGIEDAIERLRICPRKTLSSLSHLRIEGVRIKPIECQALKAGGKADVEAAILISPQASSSSISDDGQCVAVKKLRFDMETNDERALAPLAHEVDLLNDLSHENVVKIVGFVEDVEKGVAWMVFDWEQNGNLREFIQSAKWELPERICLIDDVVRGLSYLHGRNPPICHGDLKSLNILVNSENRAVITDFGSARAAHSATHRASRGVRGAKASLKPDQASINAHMVDVLTAEIGPTGEGITMTGPAWTIRWAAPELLGGDPPGLASDIWALGWICWEAVTGNFPFDKENDIVAVIRITRGDLPTIENDDQLKQIKQLCSLMRDCWKLEAGERPTATKCQQVVSWMDRTIPSLREASSVVTPRSSGLLYALGWIRLRNSMFIEAREYFEQSLEVSALVGDECCKARALKAIGDAFYLRNEDSKAEESYIQARDIYSQIGDRIGFAQSVDRLGDVYRMRDEYCKAEDLWTQARDIYSQVGDQLGFAQSLKSLGDLYHMRNEYPRAEESYVQARDIHAQIGNQLGLAQSVKSLGDLYYMRSELSRAEESYIQAHDIYSRIGSPLGIAQSVDRLGDVYRMRDECTKAEESYTQARDIYDQVGNQLGFAQSVNNLGDLYRMRNEYSRAKGSYVQAQNIYSQIGNQLGFAQSTKSLGNLYYIQKHFSKAEELYTRAREIYSQIGSPLGSAQSLEGIGHVHSAQGEYAKAEELYLESQRIYRRVGDLRSSANILWYLGWLHRKQAQYSAAERVLSEASTIYSDLGIRQYAEECNELLEEIRRIVE